MNLRQIADPLHQFLVSNCLENGTLVGPDPGVRFNYRFWRFLKSYVRRDRWYDDRYYMQGQGYWILANWMLADLDPSSNAEKLAIEASNQIVEHQRDDGAWEQPNPEWKGRVTTVEGVWASIGLMESYRHTGRSEYRDACLRWHQYFEKQIGFQTFDSMVAVNYFANEVSSPVPNNAALALRYLAALAEMTEDQTYSQHCDGLMRFIRTAQLPTGEVPYVYGEQKFVHFQCFQYQAFIFFDLLDYYRRSQDDVAKQTLVSIVDFLKRGISPQGFAYYECGGNGRTVNYHTCAISSALALSPQLGVKGCDEVVQRAFHYLRAQQREDGSFPHSRGDYQVLSDRRSYPRYLAMMLCHLLAVTTTNQKCI